MRKSDSPSITTGRIALATGIASIMSTILIILFYTVGGPFGTLNDISNGVAGILSGVLAWMLFSRFRFNSTLQWITVVLAMIGVVIIAIGSILIIYDLTGWVLAGWYTTVGNALIGIWLLAFSTMMRRNNTLPHGLSTFGVIVGSIMTIGIFAIPGMIMRIDSMEFTPWYVSLGYLGFLGTYFLYPMWTIQLGRTLLSR